MKPVHKRLVDLVEWKSKVTSCSAFKIGIIRPITCFQLFIKTQRKLLSSKEKQFVVEGLDPGARFQV